MEEWGANPLAERGESMKKLILAIPFLLLVSPAWADLRTGNQLLADCNQQASGEWFTCAGYILPATASAGQIIDMVKQYLVANPNTRHGPASLIIYVALSEAFPRNN